jgi:predicted TIM-barrel fold metal-dependent hydrolase
MTIPRRQFLLGAFNAVAGVAGWAACVSSASVSTASSADAPEAPAPAASPSAATRPASSPAPSLPIVDSHQHVWDLKRFRLPWLDNAGPVLKRDFTPADYAEAAAGLNVEKAVYIEVAVTPDQRVAEADYVIDLCRHGGTLTAAAVLGGGAGADGFRDYAARFKDTPAVKGVRESYRRGAHKDPKFLADIRLLGELGMSLDLLADGGVLAEVAELAAACPETRMILDHTGGGSAKWFTGAGETDDAARRPREQWRQGIQRLAERPNVYCKISGVAENAGEGNVTAEGMAPVVNHCLDAFGPDRVVFGSNWPVCLRAITYRRWVEALRRITAGRGEAFQRKLFHDNAARFYRLGR